MISLIHQGRKLWQRIGTNLPSGHAAFDALFPPDTIHARGIFQARFPFTGVLREQPGQPFRVEPTQYADGVPGALAGEDRTFVTAEPNRRLFALGDAGVCTPHGVVYDPVSRRVVRETLEYWDKGFADHAIFATPGFPAAQRLGGTSFLLGSLGGQTFYHFFLENLPKLALLADLAPQVDQLLVPRYGEEWKTRWLEQAGWKGKIVWLDELAHFRCEQLLFASRLVQHFEPNPWAVATLRSLFPTSPRAESSPATIWLDRKSSPARHAAWEHEISPKIDGATPVDFASLAPQACIDVCAGARALVGLHGAAFSNMIFCPPGAKIVELMTQPFYPWYARLAQVCGHRHLAVRIDGSAASIFSASDVINRFLRPS